jgi:hypothetical protein
VNVHWSGKQKGANFMPDKKPWTMMVYLAADNNLFTFGVDSLRQMKAAAGSSANILAEFDTGPMSKAKRYFFDGREPIGSIEDNVVDTFGPTDAADPDNLANFIEWGTTNYPADHYYVVIWGHGGGIDDDFPRQPDNTFVPRHKLLSGFKGTADNVPKGIFNSPSKGTADNIPKGTADNIPKGTADNIPKTVLNGHLQRILGSPLQEIGDVLRIGDNALHMAVVDALQQAVSNALQAGILGEIEHLAIADDCKVVFNGDQKDRIEKMRGRILQILKQETLATLENGPLSTVRSGILVALQKGIFDALQTGVLYELQKAVLRAVQSGNPEMAVKQIQDAALGLILRLLQNGILEAQQMGLLDQRKNILPPTKSLAFVDHPEDFLSNLGLKAGLAEAANRIYQKIDILGMDSCNMNMIEIAYELRESVNFMVASQDGVPDASWPYDRIIAKLVNQPGISPKELARQTAITYVQAYNDYVNPGVTAAEQAKLAQPVTLSVLDLQQCEKTVPLLIKLVNDLKETSSNFNGMNAISAVREQVRTFGEGQFIDLIHFCELLTEAEGNPASARSAAPANLIPNSADIVQLTRTASSIIGPLKTVIVENQRSNTEANCNGTSVYFPEFDPDQAEHERRLAFLYRKLGFATATGWGDFVSEFLKQQKTGLEAAQVTAGKNSAPDPVPAEAASYLENLEKEIQTLADQLTAAAQKSKSTASPLNGGLFGAARVTAAVASEVKTMVITSKNGGGNGGGH